LIDLLKPHAAAESVLSCFSSFLFDARFVVVYTPIASDKQQQQNQKTLKREETPNISSTENTTYVEI